MKPQELVATLKAQHRILQETLVSVLSSAEIVESKTGNVVYSGLQEFKGELAEHLNLENGVFYPDYKKKKKERGESLEGTEAFILKMDEIGSDVSAFLSKYDSPEAIDNNSSDFVVDLRKMIGTLNIRIETEEEGVYDFYLVM